MKLLEKTPEGETMVNESSNHESNPEIQEFKMIEKMIQKNSEPGSKPINSSMEQEYNKYLDF